MSLLKEKYDLLNAYNKILTEASGNRGDIPFDSDMFGKMMTLSQQKGEVPDSELNNITINPRPVKNPAKSNKSVKPAKEIIQQALPKIDKINQLEAEKEDRELDFDELSNFSPGEVNIAAYENTDLPEWGFKDLEPLITRSYLTKEPLLIYGDPGVGKSSTVEYFAEHIAAPSKDKIFRDWRDCTQEEKSEMIRNPDPYFVLITELVNKMEPSDFMGVPVGTSLEEYLETKQLKWIVFMSRANADGILFLDEINLGSPQILQSLYEVILDKSFAGTRASKHFSIMAAGNIAGMFTANVEPLPRALVDRFTSGVIVARPEEWLEYAEKYKVDRRIIAFVKSDMVNNFYAKPTGDSDPFPTPRSLVKLSKKMKQISKEYNTFAKSGRRPPMSYHRAIGLEAAAKCGVKWANGFVTFLSHIKSFDLKNLTNDIANINKKEQSELMALSVFLTNKVRLAADREFKTSPISNKMDPNAVYNVSPESHEVLFAFASVLAYIHVDAAVTLWTYIKYDLSAQQGAVVLLYLRNGNYDEKVKKLVLERLDGVKKVSSGDV